jgi:hypothetical protein
VLPAFISGWDAQALKARVAFGPVDQEALAPPETALERRYALRAVKQRLHQASFREAVITAYGGRCALSGLPEPMLLDAAHIVSDNDEQFGQPVVPNGIPLSKIHHAAFDAHLGRAPGGGVAGASRPRSAPAHSAVASGRLAVVIADSPVGLGCEHQRNRGTDDDRRQTGPADAFGKDPRRKLSS